MFLLFVLIAAQVDFVVGSFIGPIDDTEKAQGFVGYSCMHALNLPRV
jgi:solute carrier family 12 sodium/potassium/chloride transporter 2